MTAFAILAVGIAGALLVLRRRFQTPGAIKNSKELAAIQSVARAAGRTLAVNDPARPAFGMISIRLGAARIPFGAYLTAEEIRLLAPHIDRWMRGETVHDLPAYGDYSDGALTVFKERMIANGTWPATPTPTQPPGARHVRPPGLHPPLDPTGGRG